jgi:hypothetical protein
MAIVGIFFALIIRDEDAEASMRQVVVENGEERAVAMH